MDDRPFKRRERVTRIICADDCGNAPRKALLRDFNVAFAHNDAEAVLEPLSDEIVWTMVGDRTIRGKDAVARALAEMAGEKPALELRIDHIITHGTDAALDGVISFEGSRRIAFCDVYVFSSHAKSARINEMTSYTRELPEE